MRDWKAYAGHLRALREQDPAGVFVGADVVLELLEECAELYEAMVRISAGDELCDYCANSPDRNRCVKSDLTCLNCPCDCVCKDCNGISGFVWVGKKTEPAPEVVVTDEPPTDPANARWIIAILADDTVQPVQFNAECPGLDVLQSMVGGNIETLEFRVPRVPGRFIAVFDEEGKLKELPVNETASEALGMEIDYLAGTVLLLKIEGENIVTLTADETGKLMDALGAEWEVRS